MKQFSALVRYAFCTFVMSLFALSASANQYRLVSGDTLEVNLSDTAVAGQTETFSSTVDLDGRLRLPYIGGVSVEGLTLDEAEEQIAIAFDRAVNSVDRQLFVSIDSYAPIVISGDVTRAGMYDYVPNMRVSSAFALAGGEQTTGVDQVAIERARVEITGQLEGYNLDALIAISRIARLESELAEGADIIVAEELLLQIPVPNNDELSRLITVEREVLKNNRARAEELNAHWTAEINVLERQRIVSQQRLTGQEEVATRMLGELEAVQASKDKALATNAQVSRAEQRASDARDRLLELEALLITIERGIGDIERQRIQFTRTQREQTLKAIQVARFELEQAKLRFSRGIKQLSVLDSGNVARLTQTDVFELSFDIRGPREGREYLKSVPAETEIWPGETLIVNWGLASVN